MTRVVRRFMTPSPLSVEPRVTLGTAHQIMLEHGFRHLPVVEEGRVVGLLSDRDVQLLLTLPGGDLDQVLVEEAMSQEVYCVSPETPLTEVAAVMGARKLGSCIIVEDDKMLGIFTTVDALKALAEEG